MLDAPSLSMNFGGDIPGSSQRRPHSITADPFATPPPKPSFPSPSSNGQPRRKLLDRLSEDLFFNPPQSPHPALQNEQPDQQGFDRQYTAQNRPVPGYGGPGGPAPGGLEPSGGFRKPRSDARIGNIRLPPRTQPGMRGRGGGFAPGPGAGPGGFRPGGFNAGAGGFRPGEPGRGGFGGARGGGRGGARGRGGAGRPSIRGIRGLGRETAEEERAFIAAVTRLPPPRAPAVNQSFVGLFGSKSLLQPPVRGHPVPEALWWAKDMSPFEGASRFHCQLLPTFHYERKIYICSVSTKRCRGN